MASLISSTHGECAANLLFPRPATFMAARIGVLCANRCRSSPDAGQTQDGHLAVAYSQGTDRVMPTVGKNFLQPTFLSTFASSTGACLASLRSTAPAERGEVSFSSPVSP